MVLWLGFLRDWPEIGGKDWIWFGEGGGERVGVGKRGNKSKKLGWER